MSGDARATVVSRLGDIYFYDPQTFDAGILQRSAFVRTGAGPEAGVLDVGLDLPFYQEFVVRAGYSQRLSLGEDDQKLVTWQLRIPLYEEARYGWFTTTQLLYAGSRGFGPQNRLAAEHELGMGFSNARTGVSFAKTTHYQAMALRRRQDLSSDDLLLKRIGLQLRFAYILQLYRPPPGLSGKWTTTFSVIEAEATHFGVSDRRGGDGQISVSLFGPALHFTHRHITLSAGLAPRVHWNYGAEGSSFSWEALATFAIAQRNYLE